MRKLIATMNQTLDGICDHTAGVFDIEMHQHYADALQAASTILYGRITYQLMEDYWPGVAKNPTGKPESDAFAAAIEGIEKVIFSNTLQEIGWKNTRLAKKSLAEEVTDLKQQEGKDILVGSPSLIVALTNLGLIDEFQLCIHPVIAGGGLPLFKNMSKRIVLKPWKIKTFKATGSTVFYYTPAES